MLPLYNAGTWYADSIRKERVGRPMGLNRRDIWAVALIGALALWMFWPVTLGGKTLLPADNLFTFEPWRTFAQQWNAAVPHNELLSDLILENYAWKTFIRESIRARALPLWNPYVFAGIPFLAAGQHSALYPFSIIFYILPLAHAYGWFSALQLMLAGLAMYAFARVLGIRRLGSLVAAITYMFSGFFIVSVVFSMIIAAAAWLPALLAIIEVIIQRHAERPGGARRSALPWVAAGAVILAVQFLAGHVEISIYTLMVMALYALWRLAWLARDTRDLHLTARAVGHLALMGLLGLGLGAVQWVPLYELVSRSFREGSASYQDVVGWAYPTRQIITFFIPDFFGNPSHHGYWDIVLRQWVPAARNALGEPIQNIFWGIKNYVEAGSWVGTFPILLAVVALTAGRRTRREAFFALLALISLLLAFGTPLYAVLYYGVPGFKQLHSPFRWVFPYTLCMAVLAGIGAHALADIVQGKRPLPAIWRLIGWGAAAAGGAGLLALAVSLARPEPFFAIGDWVLRHSELAQRAFPDGRAFYSYQLRNLLIFFAFLCAGGIAILLTRWPLMRRRFGRILLWSILPIGLTAGELFILGHEFNPAVEPALLSFKPPAVAFLEAQARPFRLTTFNAPGEKTFNANVGMFYGLEDVRGYDSIITKQYVEYMDRIAPQANELLYNRIAPIYIPQYDALDSRLLDLLNVRYVMTTHAIPNPGYRLVYQGEVRIYENQDALPRAFFVAQEKVLPRPALLEYLPALEPTREVLLEEEPAPADRAALEAGRAPTPYRPADAVRYAMNSVEVDITADGAGWLVLADSYFPGWKAYVRPQGGSQDDEVERPIYRADGNFRAVRVDAGRYTVRFVYTPMSFKIGLFTAFLAGVLIFLLLAYYVWRKVYREEEGEDALLKRVAKNSLTPMILSLVNKAIDFAFAMLRLRILEPVGEGRYAFAIIFIGYFEILTLFGLGTLLTREVSKDRSRANRYLSNTVVLRIMLWLAALPLMALVAYIYYRLGALSADTAAAIGLFAIALFFSNISEVLSAVFYAHERMEIPAGLSAVTNVLKVSLGTLVLLIGWGFVGLAGVSVVVNIFTASTLFLLMSRLFFRPRLEVEPAFQREMLKTSYPLMINHLLATVFFRIDMLLLKPMQGDRVVGYYSAAYKYIDGLNIIPAYFTLAIFPVMSRFAESARDSLKRAYIASLKFLLMISLPIAAGTPFIARELILILGGGKFLPHSMIALQLLIGFLPFSYINSVTQYVLIALDEQRFLTKAFLIGVSFNFIANLLFIPRFGYQAAAVITVLSEIVLLMPFYYCVRRNIGPLPWPAIVWRPALAAGVMAAGLWLTASWNIFLRLLLAVLVYLGLLVALGAFREPDMQAVLKLMPWGRLRDAFRRRIGLRPAGEP